MLKQPHILVVGSLVMDLIVSTRRAPNAGETVIGTGFRTAPGGKGANQAVQCARLGAQATMVGRVGSDEFGKTLIDTVAGAGIDVSHISVDSRAPSAIGNILLEETEAGTQNRITVVPGANFEITTGDVAFLEQEIKHFDMVMLQLEIPMDVIELVAQYAKQAGVPVMLNSAPFVPLSDKLLNGLAYVSPNEHEAADLTGIPIRVSEEGANTDDIQRAAKILLSKGVQNVIITLGSNGSVLINQNGIYETKCVKMEHVADPTAAGDSFVGAFTTGICAGLETQQALDFAAHTAALTVSRMGAMPSLPTLEEVRSLMSSRGYSAFDLTHLNALTRS